MLPLYYRHVELDIISFTDLQQIVGRIEENGLCRNFRPKNKCFASFKPRKEHCNNLLTPNYTCPQYKKVVFEKCVLNKIRIITAEELRILQLINKLILYL